MKGAQEVEDFRCWLCGPMSHRLNSLKGGYIGEYRGLRTIGVIKEDARSLDYRSYQGIQFVDASK